MILTKKKNQNWIIVFIASYLSYMLVYTARLNMSVASTMFEANGILDKTQIGIVGSVFCFTYAIGQLFNGYFGDRFQAKYMICYGLMITGICNVVIGALPIFTVIFSLWALNGYAQSMIWGPLLRINATHIHSGKAPFLSSLLISSVAIGSVLGIVVSSFCAIRWSVSSCFFIPAAAVLTMSAVVLLVFPSNTDLSQKPMNFSIKQLLHNKSIRNMMIPAMAHGMIKDNINIWLGVYFVDNFGISLQSIAGYALCIPLVGMVGRFLFPALYSLTNNNEYKASVVAYAFCLAAVIPLCFSNSISPIIATICLCVISAMISAINSAILSIYPLRFIETKNVSFVAGIMDFMTYLGAGLSSLLFGVLIGKTGFGYMFITWGGVSVLCIIIMAIKGLRTVD